MSSNYHLEFSSFSLEFQGVDEINTLTMFAYADKNEANTSNNKTFLSHSQTISQTQFNKTSFVESPNLLIKNTVKSPYENTSGSFEKQTFISSIGLYDEQKNLIGIAKLATPVKKTNERSFMFKLKLDI
jgi:ABC-type sugar transport system ATPase subunit